MTTDHAKVVAYALALSQAQERLIQARDLLQAVEEDARLPDDVRNAAASAMTRCSQGSRTALWLLDGLRR